MQGADTSALLYLLPLSHTVSELSQLIVQILDTAFWAHLWGLRENVWTHHSFVLSQITRSTDGQTEFLLLYRVCIPCSMVKVTGGGMLHSGLGPWQLSCAFP